MAAGGSLIHAGLLPHSFNLCLGSSQTLDWVQNELVGRKMSILHGNRDGRKLLLHQKTQADEKHMPGGPQWAALEPEPPCEIPPVLSPSKMGPARATWLLDPEERGQHYIVPGRDKLTSVLQHYQRRT